MKLLLSGPDVEFPDPPISRLGFSVPLRKDNSGCSCWLEDDAPLLRLTTSSLCT